MKSVLLIGLGRFGRHMAQKLSDLNHQVLVIDKDEHKIQEAMSYVTNAEIGDATDPALIDSLGVKDFDLCVVTMSHDLQASLEVMRQIHRRRFIGLSFEFDLQGSIRSEAVAHADCFVAGKTAETVGMNYPHQNAVGCLLHHVPYKVVYTLETAVQSILSVILIQLICLAVKLEGSSADAVRHRAGARAEETLARIVNIRIDIAVPYDYVPQAPVPVGHPQAHHAGTIIGDLGSKPATFQSV